MSKGSQTRVTSVRQYADNYDRIFSNGEDRRKWGYAEDRQAERWDSADATTREEAIADGRARYDGESFAICRCTPIDAEGMLPSADEIVEQMAESADDNYGWVEDWPDVSQAALDELNELMRTWVRRHVANTQWQADDIEEVEGLGASPPLLSLVEGETV